MANALLHPTRSKKLSLAIAASCLTLSVPLAAETVTQRAVDPPARLQLDTMPTGVLVTLIMRDVMRVPYVIAPEVLQDRKPVSVNLTFPRSELPVRVVRFLRGIGLVVELKGGTVYVSKRPLERAAQAEAFGPAGGYPSGSPLEPAGRNIVAGSSQHSESVPEPVQGLLLVTPANRDAGELADELRSVLPDLLFSVRGQEVAREATIEARHSADMLAISGRKDQLELARELVVQLDKPIPLVRLRAAILEVRSTERSGSALELLASLLGGRLSIGSNLGPRLPQSIGVAIGGVSAVLSAVKGDSRVELLAEPMLASVSGGRAMLNSGAQVPTLGSVSYTDNGQPIQSIEYRDSGVTLELLPVVRGDLVELTLRQERSSFARTETGVNDTPTLNKSASQATVRLKPGEAIALAGLDETSASRSKSGLFGGLLGAKSREHSDASLVLVVQAEVEPALDGGKTGIVEIGLADKRGDGEGATAPCRQAEERSDVDGGTKQCD